jgi:hypothetical protein
MNYSKDSLDKMLARVRQERISVQHGSPSDVEIGQAQLADMACDYIPGLVEALSTTTEQLAAAQAAIPKGGPAISTERFVEIRQALEALPQLESSGRVRPATGCDWSDYALDLLKAYDSLAPKPAAPVLQEGEAGEVVPGRIYLRHEVEHGPPAAGAGIPVEPALRMTQLPGGRIFPPCWPCPGCLATQPSECMGTACVLFKPDNKVPVEPWRAVFPTEGEYNASVERNIERLASGEIQPREPDEDENESSGAPLDQKGGVEGE